MGLLIIINTPARGLGDVKLRYLNLATHVPSWVKMHQAAVGWILE
jgi:hypothetical protein